MQVCSKEILGIQIDENNDHNESSQINRFQMDQIKRIFDDCHLSCTPELVHRASPDDSDLWELEIITLKSQNCKMLSFK